MDPALTRNLLRAGLWGFLATIGLFGLYISRGQAGQASYEVGVLRYRAAQDSFLRAAPDAPGLLAPGRLLKYYPVEQKARYELVLRPLPYRHSRIAWLPSTQGTPMGLAYAGYVQLPYNGKVYPMLVYTAQTGSYIIPFEDSYLSTVMNTGKNVAADTTKRTAGATSGASKLSQQKGRLRYLDGQPAGRQRIVLDFNLAYLPYCTYNPELRCPLAPKENMLPFVIEAGQRE
jgi:uncharacterized protein (DUF1684 family)